MRLQLPGLPIAPGQHNGEDHEHRDHGGGNQHRINWHNDLLLHSSEKYGEPEEAVFDTDQIRRTKDGSAKFKRRP
jgi:hypothetical protein